MTWLGRTTFSQIGVGTSLRLEHVPTDPGHTPSQVQAGSEIAIEMAGGVQTKATILNVADNEIELKMPDGAVWRMTHLTPYDPPVHITSPGLSHQDWMIRSARPFTPPSSANKASGGVGSSGSRRRRAADARRKGQ
jgi:hypothetical protein